MRKPINIIQSLEFRSFVAGFKAESAALWFLCFYIMLEYIRPQSMYPALDIIPWGQFAILSCVASVFLTQSRAIGFGAMDKMFIVFSLIVILSAIFAWDTQASLKHWTTYTSWILMYFCIVSILTTPNRILLFTLFFILVNFKLSQHGARTFAMRGFSFSGHGLTGPPGWFRNSGEYGLQMVVIFSISLAILLALREYVKSAARWWTLIFLFPGTAAVTVLGSSTRGGQIAFLAVLMALFLKRRQLFKKLIYATVVLYIGFQLLPETQITRFTTMGDDPTSQARLVHWENAIDVIENNPLGIGYKNWIPYYAENYNPELIQEIHNTVLQVFVELGYPGGILFLIMLIATFVMNVKTIREMNSIDRVEAKTIAALARGINLGLLGTFIAALFMSVLYYPMFWLAFSLTSALRHIALKKVKSLANSTEPTEIKQT
jgi:O-antigen ligase